MPLNRSMGRLPLFFVMSLTTFALTACDPFLTLATQPPTVLTQVQLERPQIDPASLQCSQRPQPPDAGAMQSDVAVYVREMSSAYDDCASKLADVEKMLRPTQEVTP